VLKHFSTLEMIFECIDVMSESSSVLSLSL